MRLLNAVDKLIAWYRRRKALRRLAKRQLQYTETAFLKSVDEGQSDDVRDYLMAGMSPDTVDEAGETALLRAVESGCFAVLQRLIEGGADVNASNRYRRTALWQAVDQGRVAAAMALLKAGSNVDARSKYGETPLKCAARQGHVELTEILLAANADPNLTDDDLRSTPLMEAALRGRTRIVELLLAKGAKVNALQATYDIASQVAAMLKIDVDTDLPYQGGRTALGLAVSKGHVDIVRILLASGADANCVSYENKGLEPLLTAVMTGHAQIVQMLLNAGARVNITNRAGTTLLELAEERRYFEVAKLLRTAGAE